ncbi:hypothetical protein CU020_2483 [Enterococcus faecium]|nr:hypothetical protein [Enterococcus faecium]
MAKWWQYFFAALLKIVIKTLSRSFHFHHYLTNFIFNSI